MGKVALVTGASRGIGEKIAGMLAREGYHLGLCCKSSEDKLLALAKELRTDYGIQTVCAVGDVGDYAFVQSLVQQVSQKMGDIEVLVNNAGISYIGLLTDMTPEDWNRIVNTNLTSCFNTTNLVVPRMVKKQRGKIVNISSVWGNVGASCEVAYSATKGGINAFTKALAKELAPSNIQVNAIACGVIDTEMNRCFSEEERQALMDEIPAGRFGTAEEVGDLVRMLISQNEYLTGQIITLDGGWT